MKARLLLATILALGGLVNVPASATARSTPPDTIPSTDAMMSTIRDLVALGPRSTGSPGGRAASDYVEQRFNRAGLSDVHVETATSYDWSARDYGLTVAGRRVDAYPVSHSLITGPTTPGTRSLGPAGVTAPVVDIGAGGVGNHDVRGKYVLFDLKFELPLAALLPVTTFLWDPRLTLIDIPTLLAANPYLTSQQKIVQDATAGGAVGVIGVLADYFDSNRYHNEYYRKAPMTLPGMWVTKAEGQRIRSSMTSNGRSATMKLTAERRQVQGRTVIGFLPGRTRDTVMVQSHHDSQGPGAVEDASGTAEVIALAEHYAAQSRKPGYRQREKTLMFITFDTHFTGYQSHMAFAKKYVVDRSTPYRIVANTTIEHIGRKARVGRDGRLETLNVSEPRGIFENLSLPLKLALNGAVAGNDLQGTAVLNATPFEFASSGIPTDASFTLVSGVPTASLIAGPIYMYDDLDTIDKVDQGQLRPVANAFRQIVDAMDPIPSSLIGLVPSPLRSALPTGWE